MLVCACNAACVFASRDERSSTLFCTEFFPPAVDPAVFFFADLLLLADAGCAAGDLLADRGRFADPEPLSRAPRVKTPVPPPTPPAPDDDRSAVPDDEEATAAGSLFATELPPRVKYSLNSAHVSRATGCALRTKFSTSCRVVVSSVYASSLASRPSHDFSPGSTSIARQRFDTATVSSMDLPGPLASYRSFAAEEVLYSFAPGSDAWRSKHRFRRTIISSCASITEASGGSWYRLAWFPFDLPAPIPSELLAVVFSFRSASFFRSAYSLSNCANKASCDARSFGPYSAASSRRAIGSFAAASPESSFRSFKRSASILDIFASSSRDSSAPPPPIVFFDVS
mmetsp:Transcript_17022/g.42175  ORF Transcript_17022/g.42175 Transcript_17022/m.42175 type:complete len:341 (-) Transcript_17022:397-1419(-)